MKFGGNMEKYIVSADSTVDITPELIAQYNINIAPLSVILGESEYLDGVTLTPDDIYAYVDKTGVLPRTAAINQTAFAEHFDKIRGGDKSIPVIHFTLSSELSCSCQNAKLAAADVQNVHVVDCRSLSTGTSLLMLKALDMLRDGASIDETLEFCANNTGKVQASFVVDDLLYLYKGGRCKGLTMYVAKLALIHPMLHMQEGFLKPDTKFMGPMKIVLTKYVKHLKETHPNPDKTRVFLTHTKMDEKLVEHTRKLIKEYFEFDEIIETVAGATITSHCGPGTLGVLFLDK